MGAKDSKPCFLTYEDAVKRGKTTEYTRLVYFYDGKMCQHF